MKRTILIVVAFVVIASALAYGLTQRLVQQARQSMARAAAPAALTPAAGLTLQMSDKPIDMPAFALHDLAGQPISNESLRGKVVLMNFWATWCGPCRDEIPMLVALQDHYRDHLVVVGLSIDERPAEEVKQFADQFAVNYPIVMANDALKEAFGGITAVPMTFVVNPSGKIVQRHLGILAAARTEHEVRALSGMPTDASIETVRDTGQVLLANAAYATEIPGVDLTPLAPDQRESALKRLNTEHCACGCGLTLAQCRINDPTCEVSLPIARQVAVESTLKSH